MKNDTANLSKQSACEDCGAMIVSVEGYPDICDNCYSDRGACCADREDEEKSPSKKQIRT